MITVNLDKAKAIAHDKRRSARAEEFKPHDEVIMKQISGNSMVEAEEARQAIRDKYSELQEQMNSAQTVEELKALLP